MSLSLTPPLAPFPPTHTRAHAQNLVYSHAALALWPLGALLVNADTDEYLITPNSSVNMHTVSGWVYVCARGHTGHMARARTLPICALLTRLLLLRRMKPTSCDSNAPANGIGFVQRAATAPILHCLHVAEAVHFWACISSIFVYVPR